MVRYRVKEVFYTLQGEGQHAGRPAVFCRFSLCNLWSGRERDRHRATCRFCDTDFVGTDGPGGGVFESVDGLAGAVAAHWPHDDPPRSRARPRMVVCTGGEPLLQLDEPLVAALHERGFYVAIETNGTLPVPRGVDWVCVSPKAGAELRVTSGDELKLVHPQAGHDPSDFEHLDFGSFRLQPRHDERYDDHLAACIDYCLRHPAWSLSLQTHKVIGVP